MKKLVLFLMIVFMGVFPTLNSYAKCDIKTDTTGNTSDDVLYLQKTDWAGNPEAYGPEKESHYLKCDSNLGGSSACQNDTLILIAKNAYVGNSFRGLNEINGGSIIKCEAGRLGLNTKVIDAFVNDKWLQDGTIDNLPECNAEDAQKNKYTVNILGKTIHCKRKENRNGHEYCIGFDYHDFCIGQAKEPKAEAKQPEPIEENNERQVCDKDADLYFNPDSGVCEQKQEEKPEEKKEEPKKAEPKKAKRATTAKKQSCEEMHKGHPNRIACCKAGKKTIWSDPKDLDGDHCYCVDPKTQKKDDSKTWDGSKCVAKSGTGADAANSGAVAAAAAPAAAAPAADANSQYSKEFKTCRAEVGLDIRNIQNGQSGTRYHIKTNADSRIKDQYKVQYGEELDAKAQPSNVETFVLDTSTVLYCAQYAPKNESTPAAVPAAATGENNSNDEWAALRNDAERIVKAYNDQKAKLKNVEQPKEEETAQPNENKSTPIIIYSYEKYTATSLDDARKKVDEYCKEYNRTWKCQDPDTSQNWQICHDDAGGKYIFQFKEIKG